ncbi:hypothetical protein TPY_1534 [Sulfobacillus acidophilus TPY]|nr:hypothetical protein TPY_1534 [Sulfobacillus acidophilus TPY]
MFYKNVLYMTEQDLGPKKCELMQNNNAMEKNLQSLEGHKEELRYAQQ